MRYKRLDYVVSNGYQYIDTGVTPNHNTTVVCDFQTFTQGYYGQGIFGCYDYDTSNGMLAMINTGEGYIALYNTFHTKIHVFDDYRGRHVVKITPRTFVVDGITYETEQYFDYSTTYNILLFSVNNLSDGDIAMSSCKIYDGDTLIRDYIPAMDEDGKVGMLEVISGEFLTSQGAKEFYAGSVIGYIVDKSEKLTSLEYIESNECQYIVTNYLPNKESKVVCELEFLDGGQEQYPTFFGTFYEDNNAGFSIYKTGVSYYLIFGSANGDSPFEFSYGRHTLTLSNDATVYDGVSYEGPNTSDFFINKSLYLFSDHYSEYADFFSKMRVYSFKIYESDVLVRDYFPKMDSKGFIGLYDSVSGTLFTSASEYSFIAGPEISEGLDFESYPFGFRRRLLTFAGQNIETETFNITWSIQTGSWTEIITPDTVDGKTFTSVSPGDNGSTVIRCTFSGCESITFRCLSRGEYDYDYLNVGYIDSLCTRYEYQYSLDEYKDVVKYYTFKCDKNEHFVEFCYSKDGSYSESPDCAVVSISEIA